MPLIQRGEFAFSQTFGKGHHAGVNHTQSEIVILELQFPASGDVVLGWDLYAVAARQYVVQECEPYVHAQPPGAPVIEFRKNKCRNDQVFVGLREKVGAGGMVRIGAVERCQKRTRIEDQRHARSVRVAGNGFAGDVRC